MAYIQRIRTQFLADYDDGPIQFKAGDIFALTESYARSLPPERVKLLGTPTGSELPWGGAVTADSIADTLESAATTAPADLARIQASVSGVDVAPIFVGDVVQATYSISVRSGPGWLTEVYCASGSAVLLSVYDNNATGTGRVAFTDTFSAGKRVAGRWPLVNGAVALFDTGVFEFVFAGE